MVPFRMEDGFFCTAFSVGRVGSTSLPAFVEESRDRKPELATNPERIGSAFDVFDEGEVNSGWLRMNREREARVQSESVIVLFCIFNIL